MTDRKREREDFMAWQALVSCQGLAGVQGTAAPVAAGEVKEPKGGVQ